MVSIRWFGHSCFRIGDGKSIVVDPHDGHSLGLKPPNEKGDIILITHDHFDHNCYRVVQKSDSTIVNGAGERIIGSIKIEGFPAYHDAVEGKQRGGIVVYCLELDGIKMCHLGDIGHPIDGDLEKKLSSTDILFLPIGGHFTIDADGAWGIVEKLKPKVVIPMHYKIGGLSLRLDPLENFTVGREDDVTTVGNEIQIERSDLPEEFEIWVFSL
jgi:Predicted Zn-dependent hydrolases of the beta-lactamase fold